MIPSILDRILSGGAITPEEALTLLHAEDKYVLYEAAHQVTEHFMGNQFDTCSIVNAKSGNCPENCRWCAQSAHYATMVEKYRWMDTEEMVAQATRHHQQGVKRFSLVASGRRATPAETEQAAEAYRRIKAVNPTMKCCASLGLLHEEQLRTLFESGVTTYHCNMETAPSYFDQLCTTHSQRDKEETIAAARRVGMRVCSGGIIGMGETAEQRIELAFYLKSLEVKSIPINFLQPIPGTPLEHSPRLTEEDVLTTIALFRLIHPTAYLRFSGGRMQLSVSTQRKAIYVGINAAITGDLLTTTGQLVQQDMKLIAESGKVNQAKDWEVRYDF